MDKAKKSQEAKPRNQQEKLYDAVHSVPGDNRNQNHNAKKEALGPNTNR